jgi:adenine deaminase
MAYDRVKQPGDPDRDCYPACKKDQHSKLKLIIPSVMVVKNVSTQKADLNELKNLVAVARGDRKPALLLKNGQVVNVLSGDIVETNLAIEGGMIAALGREYTAGREVIDLKGMYLVPGLIDAHLHIESTLLLPAELARVITPRGTTTVIHDPHEVANVLGLAGVELMLETSRGLPCDFMATAPSCVPATTMETAGSELNIADIEALLDLPRVVGLGEMMNYPGVIAGDEAVLQKTAAAHQRGKVVDGHAPELTGAELQAYLAAGISSDHECLTAAEAKEKLNLGMKIIIRHGSASSSLAELLPLVRAETVDLFMFGSDDREAAELLERGHLDDLLRSAVALGGDPLLLIRIATINAARHYRLYDRGALAPGYRADLVAFDNLADFRAGLVIKNGQIVAKEGKLVADLPLPAVPQFALDTIHLARRTEAQDFMMKSENSTLPVIGVIPGQISTAHLTLKVKKNAAGEVVADPADGLCKIAVVERHRASGRIAVALIKGLGLRTGAIASSVAHDSHNIIVAGVEEEAMAAAVAELARIGGGFVVCGKDQEILATLPLPLGGLISTEPAAVVAGQMRRLLAAARSLGVELPQPFITLAFMALPVIPALKITDHGLFDVEKFSFL